MSGLEKLETEIETEMAMYNHVYDTIYVPPAGTVIAEYETPVDEEKILYYLAPPPGGKN